MFFQSFDQEREVVLQEGFPFSDRLVAESNAEDLSKPSMIGVVGVVEKPADTTRRREFIFAKLFASRGSVGAVYILLGDLADIG